MRTRQTYVIFVGDHGWKIGACADAVTLRDVPIAPDAPPEVLASAITTALKELGASSERVTLAIPSHWCLCATIEGDSLRSSRRQAMIYLLEEQLPIAAEEFAADFIADDERRALGVAVQIRFVKALVDALEAAGSVVQSICPTTLLAAQYYVALPDRAPCDALLFAYEEHLEYLLFKDDRLIEWDVLPVDAEDVARELSYSAMTQAAPLRLACSGVEGDVLTRLRNIAEIQVSEIQLPPPQESAALSNHTAALGGASPWVQLRRDGLGEADPYHPARKSMRVAALATLAFCVVLALAMVWRGMAYQRLAEKYDREQQQVYAKVFPGKTAPASLNIASRLATEERQLNIAAGASEDLPARTSALLILQRLLSRMPADARCQVNELRITDEKVFIDGIAPSHGDAATFAAALAADRAFQMDTPRTEQLAGGGGVTMTVEGVANLAQNVQVKP